MKKVFPILVVFAIFCCSSSLKFKSQKSLVEVHLDSIFINGYAQGEYSYPSIIFFNYTLHNKSDDTINVQIRRYNYRKSVTRGRAFSIYRNDTIELFSGTYTPAKFTILPKSARTLDFNLDDNDIADLYEANRTKYVTEQDFLRDVAVNSINYFSFGKYLISDKGQTRRVTFRNPKDSADVEWK